MPRTAMPVSKRVPSREELQNAPNAIIRHLVDTNPKRQGTAAHRKFSLMEPGMTVGQYLALEGQHAELDTERHWPYVELRWCIRQGYVTLETQPA
jgi:hypothetical protein